MGCSVPCQPNSGPTGPPGASSASFGDEVTPPRGFRAAPPPSPPPPPEPKKPDPFAVLGVSPTCTEDELKKAYRAMVILYHPDKVAHLAVEFRDRNMRCNAASIPSMMTSWIFTSRVNAISRSRRCTSRGR